MTISDYTKLKESVILAVSKDRDYDNFICRLKDIFRNEINSVRRSEQIRSVADLIQVLEKRNELADDNVVLLKTVAGAMRSGGELLSLITQYEQRTLSGSVLCNSSYYGTASKKPAKPEPAFSTPNITSKKRSLIYETIACEIGIHWRDLARSLEIREGQIQIIQKECKNFSDRATKVLELSEHRSDPHKWFFQLCDALETARRKDLRKTLQEIIVMDI